MSLSMEITLLTSGAEGIPPSFMMSLKQARSSLSTEYIFNLPSGFSRLALEHRVRPGLGLRAVFATHLHGLGGLGGLLLRLKQDGHGHLSIIGPECTQCLYEGISEIVSIRTPQVAVKEVKNNTSGQDVYDDDQIQVCNLLSTCLVWTPPSWLMHEPVMPLADPSGDEHNMKHEASSSSSDSSSDSSDDEVIRQGASDTTSSSSDSSDVEVVNGDCRNGVCVNNTDRIEVLETGRSEKRDASVSVFAQLDALFSQSRLPASSGRGKSKLSEVKSSSNLRSEALALLSSQSNIRQNALTAISDGSATDQLRLVGQGAVHSPAVATNIGFLVHIKASDRILLVLCCRHEMLLSSLHLHPMLASPIFKAATASGRLIATLHLTPQTLACSRKYRDWMRTLPGPQVFTGSPATPVATPDAATPGVNRDAAGLSTGPSDIGSQSILDVTLTNSSSRVSLAQPKLNQQGGASLHSGESIAEGSTIGFQASARTVSRLNLVSPALFPLPAVLRHPAARESPDPSFGKIVTSDENNTNAGPGPGSVPGTSVLIEAGLLWRFKLDLSHYGSQTLDSFPQLLPIPPIFPGSMDPICIQDDLLEAKGREDLEKCIKELHLSAPLLKCDTENRFVLSSAKSTCRSAICSSIVRSSHDSVVANKTMETLVSDWSVDSALIQPPQPGWLASISTSILGMQQMRHERGQPIHCQDQRRVDGSPHDSFGGSYHHYPTGLPSSSSLPEAQAGPSKSQQGDLNRQAAKRLKHSLSCKDANMGVLSNMGEGLNISGTDVSSDKPVTHLSEAKDMQSWQSFDEEPPPSCLLSPDAAETSVHFLGTGSAEPSKYRGPSAILVHLPSNAFIMLDCGEGTYGALVRYYGPAGAEAVVMGLACVWLSHRHADHVLGLDQILYHRAADAQPLLVIGPWEVGRWLDKMKEANPTWRAIFLHCGSFNSAQSRAKSASWMTGMTAWCSVPVVHCRDSWGVVLEHRSGWKLVYSGDTRPCRRLEELGRQATLLIHEATFEPDLIQMAISKRHSTSLESIEVARSMQAYRTILTHFSQRYPRVPEGLNCSANPLRDRPIIAFDGLFVPFNLLPQAPLAAPLLAHVMTKDEDKEVS